MSEGLGFGRRKLINQIIEDNWKIDDPAKKKYSFNELLFIIQEMLEEEGKKYFERKTARAGHHIFREFVKLILYRNIANYDSMVLVTSEKGTGKSSAAIMLARYWCLLLGIKFSPKRHIAYNNGDVMAKIDLLNKFEPIIADEAVRFACLEGNTKIKTEFGLKKIKNLINKENFKVFSYNIKKQKEEIQLAKKCIKIREDEVFELITEDGKKIKATKNHKFLTTNGWRKLSQLNIGDEIIGSD